VKSIAGANKTDRILYLAPPHILSGSGTEHVIQISNHGALCRRQLIEGQRDCVLLWVCRYG
jgi:hypothetical protein